MILEGLSDLHHNWRPYTHGFMGVAFVLMMFAPCGLPIFNKNFALKIVRFVVFGLVALYAFLMALGILPSN